MSSAVTFVLTASQRQQLKNPLGELIKGSPEYCNKILKEAVAREKPLRLILVGDSVARNAARAGIKSDVVILDNVEMRQKAQPFHYEAANVVRVRNPAGTIEADAWRAVDAAVQRGNAMVVVEGEEDLLALVAVLLSPVGSLVVYGQPREGIVLIRVSADKKSEVDRIIGQMERKE